MTTPIRVSPSSLREGRWYEYVIRFALGGTATVFTGLVSSRYGASVGGLFLALPAMFWASATLIEKHEIRRKREAGLSGERRGRGAAASMPPAPRWVPSECCRLPSCFGCWWSAASPVPSLRHRWRGCVSLWRPGSSGASCALRIGLNEIAAPQCREAADLRLVF
jgi:Protein of unknown function (DUF3147)